MVRKIATQIPSAVSRLLQANTIPPPVWYQPVLTHPPTPLPPRATGHSSVSSAFASSSTTTGPSLRRKTLRSNKSHGLKPRPIVYEEDNLRRRFFQDFPFEALRSVSLVEGQQVGEGDGLGDEIQVDGKEWTSLAQRGAYPTVEDTISFTLNLHHVHSLSLAEAYLAAVRQFADLRGKHELASFQAEEERLVHGRREEEEGVEGGRGNGPRDVFQRFFELESKARQTFDTTSQDSSSTSNSSPQGPPSAMTRRRAWTPTISPELSESVTQSKRSNQGFTGGLEYSAGWIGEVWKGSMKGARTNDSKAGVESASGSEGSGSSVEAKGSADTPGAEPVKQEQGILADVSAKVQSLLGKTVQPEVRSR